MSLPSSDIWDMRQATVVGHDWGGMVAWAFAFRHPELLSKLIILNLPHPSGLAAEWAVNKEAQGNQAYARAFQQGSAQDPDIFFGMPMTVETLSGWGPATRPPASTTYKLSSSRTLTPCWPITRSTIRRLLIPIRPAPTVPMIDVPVLMFPRARRPGAALGCN